MKSIPKEVMDERKFFETSLRDDVIRAGLNPDGRVGAAHGHLMSEEILRLKEIIERGAAAWLMLQIEHPIRWEGDLADAMAAACSEIRQLSSSSDPDPPLEANV